MSRLEPLVVERGRPAHPARAESRDETVVPEGLADHPAGESTPLRTRVGLSFETGQ